MPQCAFWQFEKRRNSTAVPPNDQAYSIDIKLKTPTSMESPEIVVSDVTITNYNYMFLMGKYYWLGEWTYNTNNTFSNVGRKDTPATFRSHIMDNSFFVERSNVIYRDYIVDDLYPVTNHPEQRVYTQSMGFDTSGGTYVLGIAGAGGIKYVGLNPASFTTLLDYLYTQPQDSLWDTIVDFATTNLLMTFVDIMQYITSCVWIPYTVNGNFINVTIGYWTSPVIGIELNPEYKQTYVFPIDFTEMWGERLYFLNKKPFTRMSLFIPGAGTFEVDPDMVNTQILVSFEVDCKGRVLGRVAASGNRLFRFEGMLGVEIALSSNGYDMLEMATSLTGIGSSITSAAMSGGSNTLGVIGSVASALDSAVPKIYTKGGQGSFSLYTSYPDIYLEIWNYSIPEQSGDTFGYPYMGMSGLSQPGYYKISKPRLLFGDYNEKLELEAMMEGGIWIE